MADPTLSVTSRHLLLSPLHSLPPLLLPHLLAPRDAPCFTATSEVRRRVYGVGHGAVRRVLVLRRREFLLLRRGA